MTPEQETAIRLLLAIAEKERLSLAELSVAITARYGGRDLWERAKEIHRASRIVAAMLPTPGVNQ